MILTSCVPLQILRPGIPTRKLCNYPCLQNKPTRGVMAPPLRVASLHEHFASSYLHTNHAVSLSTSFVSFGTRAMYRFSVFCFLSYNALPTIRVLGCIRSTVRLITPSLHKVCVRHLLEMRCHWQLIKVHSGCHFPVHMIFSWIPV